MHALQAKVLSNRTDACVAGLGTVQQQRCQQQIDMPLTGVAHRKTARDTARNAPERTIVA
jgi:ligand-binding sensor domain-containing protein